MIIKYNINYIINILYLQYDVSFLSLKKLLNKTNFWKKKQLIYKFVSIIIIKDLNIIIYNL